MKNGLKIRWTEEATKNLENIIVYLETNWTTKELKKFFQKLEKQLLLLSIFPEAYPLSQKKKSIHQCVLTKNLTIYYTVKDDSLVLLSLFDTRQDPAKLKI
jgi:addiction module RelE/StbE family toxin